MRFDRIPNEVGWNRVCRATHLRKERKKRGGIDHLVLNYSAQRPFADDIDIFPYVYFQFTGGPTSSLSFNNSTFIVTFL